MASPEIIATCIGALTEAFRQVATKATFSAYEMGLDDMSDADLARATKQAIRTCKFMPTVSELREMVSGGSTTDRAVLAWQAVQPVIYQGPYTHVDFDDGIINATIRNLGGWPNFLDRITSPEAEKWLRKEFIDTYKSLASSRVTGDVCRPLAGLSEKQVCNGRLIDPIPLRIETGLPKLAGDTKPRLSNG